MNAFFKPHVGSNYNEGIDGNHVLVLGASFYCDKIKCPYFAQCTNEDLKDSRPFDNLCPFYDNKALHDAPSSEGGEDGDAYDKFADRISKSLNLDYNRFWDSVAFTNYIQFFLPHWETKMKHCSDRDANALIEVIKSLKPNIIFIWGCVINRHILTKFSNDIKVIEGTDAYIWNWSVDGKIITVVNTYHPTYLGFDDNGLLEKYVRLAFSKTEPETTSNI